MILRFIIWSIVLTLLLRFVLRFLFPVINMTRMAKDNMSKMQQQMEEMQRKQHTPPAKQANKPIDGDYIEYEEVK